jgi:mevalonate kinase
LTSRAIAEAPAKAIVTGEHFVVHGSTALAVAIDKQVRVSAEEGTPGAGLSIRSDQVSARNPESLLPAKNVVTSLASAYSLQPDLLLSIASGIPRGSGLGSSASTMVAVAAAVARLNSLDLRTPDIVRFAMEGERLVHGNPSGIDVNVCAYGGVILFNIGRTPRKVRVDSPIRLLIVHSGERRSTKAMINKVAYTRDKYPFLFTGVADSISEVSVMAADRLAHGDMPGLGRLLTLSHVALTSVGASNERLDRLVETLLSLGALGAKLTGAGGGGCVLAVTPDNKGKSIITQLEERGFEAFETMVPVMGVKSWLE